MLGNYLMKLWLWKWLLHWVVVLRRRYEFLNCILLIGRVAIYRNLYEISISKMSRNSWLMWLGFFFLILENWISEIWNIQLWLILIFHKLCDIAFLLLIFIFFLFCCKLFYFKLYLFLLLFVNFNNWAHTECFWSLSGNLWYLWFLNIRFCVLILLRWSFLDYSI